MTKPKTKTDDSKSKAIALVETVLFLCCLAVISLRTTFTEAPTPLSTQIQAIINDTVYSLVLSGVLILALLIWLIAQTFSGRFSYRITTMEIGLPVFLAAIIAASFAAANKRMAITSSVIILAPILMAALLTQLLDSHAKIKILLIVCVALGIVAAWQSAEQFFISNNIMLQQYREDPNSILQPLGIQPGSLNNMMLEHRIYSKDVRASFTTSNSAGSFAILAIFAAIALLAERIKNRKIYPASITNFLLAVFALAIALFGLFITRSKGAIGAFFIAMAVFALLLTVKRTKFSKNLMLGGGFAGLIILVSAVAWYGLKIGRLPGGNSLLVRWQYWQASVKMFLDHALTGVGGGNFVCIYHQYKSPSAIETVSDPHCFLLSILTQYGLFGLFGFLAIVIVPLWRASFAGSNTLENRSGLKFRNLATLSIIVPIVAMLSLRPLIIPSSTAKTFDEIIYIFFTDYAAPAAAFAVGFALLIKSLQTTGNKVEFALQNTGITAISLFCGLLGVLIHNLVDYAIFEPGVFTMFCAIFGCLIALDSKESDRPKITFTVPPWLKLAAAAIVLVISYGYFNYALLPVAKSTADVTKARRPMEIGQYQLAQNLLDSATQDDPLSPNAPSMNGRLFLQRSLFPNAQQAQLLNESEQALFIAIERNPADYKNFETLSEVYLLYSRVQPDANDLWLNKALNSAAIAVELYPGDAELHFQLAQIAEELGQTDTALKHYKTAVEIEDSFRAQFRLMYPGREVFSRLPNDKYLLARQQVKILSEKSPPAK